MVYYVEDDKNIREIAVYALKQAGIDALALTVVKLEVYRVAGRQPFTKIAHDYADIDRVSRPADVTLSKQKCLYAILGRLARDIKRAH